VNVTTKDIILAAWEDSARLVPSLWGPTRRGKTHTAIEAAMMYVGGDRSRVRVVNPALDLPEDTGGVLRVRQGRAYYTPPPMLPESWADDKPSVLILDEIDKAGEDQLCTLLTMLSQERRIRNTILPTRLRMVVIGNEPQMPLPDPLISRLLLLRFPTAVDLGPQRRFEGALGAIAGAVLPVPSIELPHRCSGFDSLTALESWLAWGASADPDVRQRLIEGLFAGEHVPSVVQELDRDPLDGDHLSEWIEKAPLAVLLNRLHTQVGLSANASPMPEEIVSRALGALMNRCANDATGEMERAYDVFMDTPGALARLGPGVDEQWRAGSKAWKAGL
jgi:hypothetical protein